MRNSINYTDQLIRFVILLLILTFTASANAYTTEKLTMLFPLHLGDSLFKIEHVCISTGWHIEQIDMEKKMQILTKTNEFGKLFLYLKWKDSTVNKDKYIVDAILVETFKDEEEKYEALDLTVAEMKKQYGEPGMSENMYYWQNEEDSTISLVQADMERPRILIHRLAYEENL